MTESRIFTDQDQQSFAELSGDFNPIHVDKKHARRSPFGENIVHGIHLVLWGLETWAASLEKAIFVSSVKARFIRPVRVGEEVELGVHSSSKDGRQKLVLSTREGTRAKVTLTYEERHIPQEETHLVGEAPARIQIAETPKVAHLEGRAGRVSLTYPDDVLHTMFPHTLASLGRQFLSVLLATTYLVGMKCPGLRSIYGAVQLSFTKQATTTASLDYTVKNFDARFSRLEIHIYQTGVTGLIEAYVREGVVEQKSYQALQPLVANNAFDVQKALVIGGSRGIGEVISKLLSAGGASVMLTYHTGEQDAKRICEQIKAGGGEATYANYDVLNRNLVAFPFEPTHVYFCATPAIRPSDRAVFSKKLFETFLSFYVYGYQAAIEQFARSKLRGIFNVSTNMLDNYSSVFAEYIAAKVASESVGQFLASTNKHVKVYQPRLGRVKTDQTASLGLSIEAEQVEDVVLDHLYHFQALTAS